MKKRRLVKWLVGWAVVCILAAVLVMYIQASRIPRYYRPARLTTEQKRQVVKDFWSRIQEFGNAAQDNTPYTWSVSEQQLNWYLAAMDEIAASTPAGQPGEIYRTLEQYGLGEPAVALRDGKLQLMVRSLEYQKVFSAILGLSFLPDKRLVVRLIDVRVGRLRVPRSWVQSHLDQMRADVVADQKDETNFDNPTEENSLSGFSPQDVGQVVREVLAAMDQEPIVPELTWPVKKKRVRIESIEMQDGVLTLSVVPIDRKKGSN